MYEATSCHLFGAPGSWSGWRSSWAARRRRGGSRLRGSQSMVMESALDRWEGMGNGGEREEGGRRRGTWSPEGSGSGSAKGSWSGSELVRVLARRGRRKAGAGGGGRQGQAGWARRGRARRLLQGPEEALARRREEERRGAGGARSADPVRGARGRRGWSPAGVGAAASCGSGQRAGGSGEGEGRRRSGEGEGGIS